MKTIARTLLTIILLTIPAIAAEDPITVIDGDTVVWRGQHWRLMGFDTPETFYSRCPGEKALGDAASARLRVLLAGGEAVIEPSGRRDRYGRELGHLTIKGRDVGEILIGEGLARAYSGGRRKGWCDG